MTYLKTLGNREQITPQNRDEILFIKPMQRINEVDIWFSEKIIKNYKHLAKFTKGMRKKIRNKNRDITTDIGDIYRLVKTEFKIYKLPN